MEARLGTWWQKIRQRRVSIAKTTAIIVVAIALIIIGYRFDATGFNRYIQVSTIHTLSGPTAGTITRTEAYQPGKTLWDWMQLLFIPVVLAVAGFWFNHRERKAAELRTNNERKAAELRTNNEQEIARQRAKADREISFDNQREAALKEYIDKISELLLHENLRKSEPESEVRKIARVVTLTVLPRLDGGRKKSVLQFLHESGLIDRDICIIDLRGADLSGADLARIKREADLEGVDLAKAKLEGVDLSESMMLMTDLDGANLDGANLRKANLSWATLNSASIVYAKLEGVILQGAEMHGTNLRGSTLHGANLEGADLRGADLGGTLMTRVDLRSSNLREAKLEYAILNGADLHSANLSGAYLKGAHLENSNLFNANLRGAKVLTEQLDKAKSLINAIMPDGKRHP